MKISRVWLQTFFSAPLPSVQELSDALTFHAFEIDGIEGDILDVKVTANRGHDCLCHRGIAKELSAILKEPMKADPLREEITLSPKTSAVEVAIRTPQCHRYIAGCITGVKVGPSPKWLQEALESIGQRSINNVVDATNYVMFTLGQPLHAFDAGQLRQKDGKYAVSVRMAKDGEKMHALDDKEYALQSSMMVIADENSGAAIGIAGVKGGKPAGVSEATTDIILESANFDGVSVRKTASALKLRTDASDRFQQVITPELAAYGIHAVAKLIQELAGGKLEGFVDVYPDTQKPAKVSVSLAKIDGVLGTELSVANVEDVFHRLDIPCEHQGDILTVSVPPERLDLCYPEDLIEEVGRIVGYDAVPEVELPAGFLSPAINPNFYGAELVREELVSQGYSEVFTSVFAESGERVVANKVDGVRPYLRSNLTNGLKDALKKNIPNKDLLGLKSVKLFEIGTVWNGGQEVVKVATIEEKKGSPEGYSTENIVGPAAAEEYEKLPLSQTERYAPFSKYPYIVRDIAMWVPEATEPSEVLDILKANAGELLVRSELMDVFKKPARPDDAGRSGGGERVSYAFRLVFQSFDKTLTDAEVNAQMEKVTAAVKDRGWEVR